MNRPLLLDLFCGAGGCARGYADAGFDVIGVDIAPQKHYPYQFVEADALNVLAQLASDGIWRGYCVDDFDAIHASPPCQGYSVTRHMNRAARRDHPLLLSRVRSMLNEIGLPWVIENVNGAPMGHFLTLCGTQFGLRVYRHRRFESSHLLMSPGHCSHPHELMDGYVCIYGDHVRGRQTGNQYPYYSLAAGRAAMGIDWPVTQHELAQAIPPAYTEWIGQQLLAIVESERVA